MANEFWLSDAQWAAIDPLLPKNRPGARRVDDRRVTSGIVHVLRTGCRWQDCPSCYGPPTTIYNRLQRWSARGLWQKLFRALVTATSDDIHMIDSTTAKAHRSAAGGTEEQAIGRSRGGRTTKIHAVVDGQGRPLAFEITPGQRGRSSPRSCPFFPACQRRACAPLMPPTTATAFGSSCANAGQSRPS
jgi:putative transposase